MPPPARHPRCRGAPPRCCRGCRNGLTPASRRRLITPTGFPGTRRCIWGDRYVCSGPRAPYRPVGSLFYLFLFECSGSTAALSRRLLWSAAGQPGTVRARCGSCPLHRRGLHDLLLHAYHRAFGGIYTIRAGVTTLCFFFYGRFPVLLHARERRVPLAHGRGRCGRCCISCASTRRKWR